MYKDKQHLVVETQILEIWSVWSHCFIAITSRSTLSRSVCNGPSPIYEPNRSVCKLFVLDKNTWYNNTVCKKLIKNYSKM